MEGHVGNIRELYNAGRTEQGSDSSCPTNLTHYGNIGEILISSETKNIEHTRGRHLKEQSLGRGHARLSSK